MDTVAESPSEGVAKQAAPKDEQRLTQQAKNVSVSGTADDSADSNQSLDLVRKILFGEQVRQTEQRQASLERHIQASVAALNEETCKKIADLREEISLLTDLLAEETQARKADLTANQKNMSAAEQSIDKLGHQVLKNHNELTERLEHEKNKLNHQMGDWRQDILQQLQTAKNTLSHEKADRQSIAVLLTEMADQLVADEAEAH